MTTTPSLETFSTRASAPKLRTSCDNCGVTKVKCDRGKPGCGRCITLGLVCVYGPSRRCGKPPRKRHAVTTKPDASLSCKKRKAWPAENCEIGSSTSNGQSHGIYSLTNQQSSNLGPGTLPLPFANSLDIDEQDESSLAFFNTLPLDEWPSFEGLEGGFDILSTPKNKDQDVQGSSSTLEPANVVRNNVVGHDTHSCPRESYEIFRDLICPSPFLHAPQANSDAVCAQLDFVLQFTRDAINRLTQLLRCSCARSGHRVMVHASIISRILIWYQQAAGWTSSTSNGPLPSTSEDSVTSSDVSSSSQSQSPIVANADLAEAPTLAQTTGFIVGHVPISLGTFDIEDQSLQTTLRNQLVLSELQKMPNLIDLFASQNLNMSSTNGLSSLYTHLGAWLHGEYLRTVKVLGTKLRPNDTNLDL